MRPAWPRRSGCPSCASPTCSGAAAAAAAPAAVANAAAAIAAGYADCVVVFRALAQGQFGRFGQAPAGGARSAARPRSRFPYGLMSPAQSFAMQVMRFMHDHGIQPRGPAGDLAGLLPPRADQPAGGDVRPAARRAEAYDDSRWIVEPFRLFDCCHGERRRRRDGAGRRRAGPRPPHQPAYLLGVAQGSAVPDAARGAQRARLRVVQLHDGRAAPVRDGRPRARRTSTCVQSYENFTGGVLMSLVEHGFCAADEANEFLTLDNLIAPTGRLPLNTSGGNLAECYMHGLGLNIEAVRQLRGESTSQVPDAEVADGHLGADGHARSSVHLRQRGTL